MPVLKDTEASLDLSFEKYAAPEIFTGEHASVKYIHDDTMTYLPPAEREIECELRHVVSKPVVSPGHLDREKYFLEGNTRNVNSLRMALNIVVMLWGWESSLQLN
ncbi:hypothetical protein TNIN_231421 [Trichonephila inaurata madagascariensis]|uniref:Uncharacterized protein n=1 Tax=Trichonephila inaurata madagascariensis TaxID=2747483 RepID=A0A8X6XXK0_9ARAC|nr:hypothetical protein TNIN_231421 [Trichonephila inaurata madagascariensis]